MNPLAVNFLSEFLDFSVLAWLLSCLELLEYSSWYTPFFEIRAIL